MIFSIHNTEKRESQTYTLTGEVCLLPLQFRENLQELLQKSNKLRSQIVLVPDVRNSLRVTSPDGLFDVQHAGQIGPTVLVHCGFVLAKRPRERLPEITTFDQVI